MGKSLNGKELGKGITQSKDGRFLGRFVNRFGKTECNIDLTLFLYASDGKLLSAF